QAPRAVTPIARWSYPADPPEAKASPSQNPYSSTIALAKSEKVAVRLSAATTREAPSAHRSNFPLFPLFSAGNLQPSASPLGQRNALRRHCDVRRIRCEFGDFT